MRGRKPLPTKIKELNSNPGRRPLNPAEPKPTGSIGEPPAYFSPQQAAIWREALKEAPPGLLTKLDESVLASFCVWRATFENATTELMLRGAVSVTTKGESKVAPEIVVLQKATLLMHKACVEMGFSPSSRSRLSYEAPKGAGNEFADV